MYIKTQVVASLTKRLVSFTYGASSEGTSEEVTSAIFPHTLFLLEVLRARVSLAPAKELENAIFTLSNTQEGLINDALSTSP